MKCPKCDEASLTRTRAGELEVDHCNECGGLWLDQSELPRLLEFKGAGLKALRRGTARAGDNQKRAKCPRCGVELLRVASAINRRVTVDKCTQCRGVWLDGGEFNALIKEE